MSTTAIINTASGSVPSDAETQLSRYMEDSDIDCDIACVGAEEMAFAIERCVAEEANRLIVWGGDGTISCALEKSRLRDVPVLALPGGTMNLIHKSIHGEFTDWRDVLKRSLHGGRIRRLPSGRINGRRFYVAALLGNLTQLARPREVMRKGDVIEAVAQVLENDEWLDLRPALKVVTDIQGKAEERRATAIGVFMDGADAPVFDVGVIQPDSVFDLAGAGLQAWMDDWRRADGVDRILARGLRVDGQDVTMISGALDGEPVELAAPLFIEFESATAKVISARPL